MKLVEKMSVKEKSSHFRLYREISLNLKHEPSSPRQQPEPQARLPETCWIKVRLSHLLVTRSGEGHLQVVEPSRSDGVEPVHHLLPSTQTLSLGTRPARRDIHILPAQRRLFFVSDVEIRVLTSGLRQ